MKDLISLCNILLSFYPFIIYLCSNSALKSFFVFILRRLARFNIIKVVSALKKPGLRIQIAKRSDPGPFFFRSDLDPFFRSNPDPRHWLLDCKGGGLHI